MKKLALFVAGFVLTVVPFALGQQPAQAGPAATLVVPKEEQATREDVLALLQVLHSRDQVVAALDMMKQQMLSGMDESFLREHPGASKKVLDKLNATMDSVWTVVSVDEMVAVTVPIYQKYLSHEDAISLISFYSSPAGQHYLSRMPTLIKEAGEAGGNLMKGHLDEVQQSAKAKFISFETYIEAHPEELGEPPSSEDK